MPRVQPRNLSPDEKQDLLDEFWNTVLLLETKEEIENFFRDLLSETEAVMISRRVRIARLLLEGRSYDDIQDLLHTSPTTIADVHDWLQKDDDVCVAILQKLQKELARKRKLRSKESAQREYGSFEWLKKRYPMHFLLFNLLDLRDRPQTRRGKR